MRRAKITLTANEGPSANQITGKAYMVLQNHDAIGSMDLSSGRLVVTLKPGIKKTSELQEQFRQRIPGNIRGSIRIS